MLFLSSESGTKFVGYGRYRACTHCNKPWFEEIVVEYLSTHAYVFIPLANKLFRTFCICDTCHYGFEIPKGDFKSITQLLLSEGLGYTAKRFDREDKKSKEQYLKLLQSLQQFEVIRYLTLPNSIDFDPTCLFMKNHGFPFTKENWLKFAPRAEDMPEAIRKLAPGEELSEKARIALTRG
jgi:hypothetical protein